MYKQKSFAITILTEEDQDTYQLIWDLLLNENKIGNIDGFTIDKIEREVTYKII